MLSSCPLDKRSEVQFDPMVFIKVASWCAYALYVSGRAFWFLVTTAVVRIYLMVGTLKLTCSSMVRAH